jgi:hypothetical protein
MAKARSVANMARKRREKRPECPVFNQTKGELEVEAGHCPHAFRQSCEGMIRVRSWLKLAGLRHREATERTLRNVDRCRSFRFQLAPNNLPACGLAGQSNGGRLIFR